MYIKNIGLINYRNYETLQLKLNKNVNVFKGDNAQGKTNILESIYYCAFAKSHRNSKDKELIKLNNDSAYISILIGTKRLDKKIDINILRNGKKAITVNGIKIRKIDELFGTFNVVMFSPEDLKVVKESPGLRRRMLDMEISQINKKYYLNLVQYNKILNERNIILKNRNIDKNMIEIYNIQLAQYGDYIIKERIKYIDRLNYYGKVIHSDITNNKEEIEIKYNSTIPNTENIQETFLEKLRNNFQKDSERGITFVGPHRDDFNIYINHMDVKVFGSQGQQRTSVLTIKFAILNIIKEILGDYPVLLLDDVLSELDVNRKTYILNSIKNIQTIITCTGMEDLKNYISGDGKIFEVSNGKVLS